MSEFNEVLNIAENDVVGIGVKFGDLINKELVLGMPAYVCEHGTLSDGHEHITPAARYYQAIKEMYYVSNAIIENKALALDAQANLIDAEEELTLATKESEKLRAQSKILKAKQGLIKALVGAKDSLRQLNAFNKVRLQLEAEVKAKYPEGIEQAQPDIWKSVAEYRSLLRLNGHNVNLTHIPLEQKEKAKLGMITKNRDLCAWYVTENIQKINEQYDGNVDKFLDQTVFQSLESKGVE